jgi:hypothetical protein
MGVAAVVGGGSFAGAAGAGRDAPQVPSSAVMLSTAIVGGLGVRATVGAIGSFGPVPSVTFVPPIIVPGGSPGTSFSSPRNRTRRPSSALISFASCLLPFKR